MQIVDSSLKLFDFWKVTGDDEATLVKK